MPATYESLAPNGHSTMVTRIFQKIKSWVEGQGYSTTDEKVKQTATSTDANYEILFSGTADNTTRIEGVGKDSGLLYNPSKDAFSVGSGVTASGNFSFATGSGTSATGNGAFASGAGTTASGTNSHAEGNNTTAYGQSSHAEGAYTTAGASLNSNPYSHAEGYYTTASGFASHAEGGNVTARGDYSHAEGSQTKAYGMYSHAEGRESQARGHYSHAEGGNTIAGHETSTSSPTTGQYAHAEGGSTLSSGTFSHAEGFSTKASSSCQHVQGKYNIEDTQGIYAHIIGNGTAVNARSNAQTIDWDGNEVLAGMLTDKHGVQSLRHLTTAQYNALTEAEKMNGVTYHLIDSDIHNAQCYYDSTNERIIFNYGASYDSTNERIILS